MTHSHQDAAHTCHTCSCHQQPKAQHRPAPLNLSSSSSSSIASSSQSKSAPPPEFRMYGRGGAGARRRVVKPAKSEPNFQDSLSRKKSFKLSDWVPKLPSSPELTSTPSESLYDMPWDGQPQTPRTGASFASSTSSSSPSPHTPSDGSPMAVQRDHFLSNLWRSKKNRESSVPSSPLSPNTSPMRSTFSLSRQSTTSSYRSYPSGCDDTTSVSSHGTDTRLTLPAFDIEKPGFMEETVIPRSSKTVVVEGSKGDDVAEVMHKLRLLK
ncbi:hypothetical protein BDZ89DRAFT_1137445 [Hymenopellis radicata]|nr:hypothetical protein BDZ89DRAFT_1137445 [Hymenopellis radicata]